MPVDELFAIVDRLPWSWSGIESVHMLAGAPGLRATLKSDRALSKRG